MSLSVSDIEPGQAPSSGMPQGNDIAPQQSAGGNQTAEKPEKRKPTEKERELADAWMKRYTKARKFDENFRKQVAIDRRYSSGQSDTNWAVSTNVVGSVIDIMKSILYARDPDVSVRKSAQVDNSNTLDKEQFARTVELVISRLWKDASLKRKARKQIVSALSVGEGWLKCNMMAEQDPNSETTTALNDARETLQNLDAKEKLLEDPEGMSEEDIQFQKSEKEALIEELEGKVELAVSRMFVIDFLRAERVQVSTDVETIEEYLDANWVGNEVYLDKDDCVAKFPDIELEDLKSCKQYYQAPPKELTNRDNDSPAFMGQLSAADAESYSGSNNADENAPPMYRVIEIWNRVTKKVITLIEGLHYYAKEEFQPPYPTARFYPYFYLGLFEVDGARHAQSLSSRLYKLQDEFSCTRSNFRIARERAIPATLFNATGIEDVEARKIAESKHQEFIPIRPNNPDQPLADLFAPKPVSPIDPRLYDTQPIMSDVQRISGVNEALQSTSQPGTPVTATQTNVEQAGTNARVTADRDMLEWMLTDLAVYTVQQALQCLTIRDVQRMCGTKAFWPAGMDIDDLFTLVEVNIKAGSTGKPNRQGDQAAWGVILPLIEKMMGGIVQARATNNTSMAKALEELIKETMLRMGDDTDVERFIPQVPPPGSPGAGATPPPPPVEVKVSLTGEISPAAAAALVQPTVLRDSQATATMQPSTGAPGGAPPPGGPPAPGGSPAGPVGPIVPHGPGNVPGPQ